MRAREQAPVAVPAEVASLTSMVTLRDGTVVRVRAIRPDDTERLRAFHERLSFETIVFRFFRVLPHLSSDLAEHLSHVDYVNRMALLATTGEGDEELIRSVVRYDRTGPDTAEVAFVVEDGWQGKGIATTLLRILARYARAHGFQTFVAITMANNARMLAVLRHCGFPSRFRFTSGEVEGLLDISQA